MYVYVQVCVSKGMGYSHNKEQEENRDKIFFGKHQNLISQLSCGVCSGQEESEKRNLGSLSAG